MQNLNTKMSYSLFFIVLFFYISPASAANTMGYIGSYKGLASDFKLTRNGKRERVEYNKPLYVGDKISVHGYGSSIELKLLDNKNITRYYYSRTYEVKDTYDRASIVGNMLSVFSDWWGSLWEASDEEKTMAGTRGNYSPTITISLLKTNQAKLKAGKKTVHLAWRGGKPPYIVTIKAKRSTQFSKETNKNIASFSKQKFPLEAGKSYSMTVTDSNDEKISQKFTVIDKLPAFKLNYKEKRQIKNSPNKRLVCAAMFRHKQHKNSQWDFEIYQIIAGGGDKKILSTCGIN